MKLLYCHVDFLKKDGKEKSFRGQKHIDLNLSATHVFSCVSDGDGHKLRVRLRDKPLPENFWKNGDEKTNIYNINVVAGKNGSGKSTVINYVIDLLYYIYLDFGRRETDIRDTVRFDVSSHYNLLVFEEANSLYVVELKPDGQEQIIKCVFDELLKAKEIHDIKGETDCYSAAKEFEWLFQGMKVVYMMNNPTQRDYERNLERQEGGLRNYFVYDCSLGANLGGEMAQYFPYEVYKQVRYMFDSNQAEIRKEIEKRIQPKQKETEEEGKKKPDELVMPKALRIRPRIDMLKDGLIQKLTSSYPTDLIKGFQDKEPDLNVLLGELCCRAFAANAVKACYADEKEVVNAASKLLYKLAAKNGSIFEEQKHCIHAVANAVLPKKERRKNNQVTCCVVLPDKRIVSGSDDKCLYVWNPDTGECLRTLKGHAESVKCVAMLSNGRIVSGSDDKTLRIWNPDTGKCLRKLKGHQVTCLAVLSNGHIVSGSADGKLRIIDANSGECLQTLDGHTDWIFCIATISDEYIVSGSADKTLRVWNLKTGECLRKYTGHTNWVKCLAVLRDGRIVSGSADNTLHIWNPNTGEHLRTLKGHSLINCVVELSDGCIVSGSDNGALRVWNMNTGENLQTPRGHDGWVNCLAVLPDGRIVSGSSDETIRVWNSTARECVSILSTDTTCQLVDMLRYNCIAYLDFFAAAENDDLFAKFDRVENEDCCFELPLQADEAGSSWDERLQRFMTEFIQRYRYTCEPVYTIDFDWGLSSGEENMLRLFSNLFHIFDRDYSSGKYGECRIYNDEWANIGRGKPHPCTSVMLFLDEADLTLHPEWQRRLIHVLTAALPLIYPNSCAKDMQLILSTHSPLLLGDIPRENICYLGGDSGGNINTASEGTFGQNIHTILKDSFFLDNGTIGEFAASRINTIASRLEEIIQNETKDAKEKTDHKSEKAADSHAVQYSRPSEQELSEMRKTIDLVADGILRVWLEERWQKVSIVLNERTHSEEAEKLVKDGKKLTQEERRYILRKWLEEEKL